MMKRQSARQVRMIGNCRTEQADLLPFADAADKRRFERL